MAADDSRRLVIDLSVITEESMTENTLVDNCPKEQTEGVMEEMDVANGDTDGFQTKKVQGFSRVEGSQWLGEEGKGRADKINWPCCVHER